MIPKEFETISEYVCKQTRWTDGSIRHDRMEDVVRCKDCIVFGTHGKNTDICPMWHNTHIDPYRDFCSRGVRKTENSSEKPNNLTGYNLSPVDKDINVRSKDEPQTCSVNGRPYSECSFCEHFRCTADEPHIVGKHADAIIIDESQTDVEIAKAIVHKMIDDAVIAEDAYPDLRQKMHDAVDEYETQTERSE